MNAVKTIDNVYISCACNANPLSMDWGYNDFVCFATSYAVALYSPSRNVGRITQIMCSHKDRVNSVRWIRKFDKSSEIEFISCSCDGTAVVWSEKGEGNFMPSAVLGGHTDSVTVADGLYVVSDVSKLQSPSQFTISSRLLVVTGSIDANIRVWIREEGETQFNNFQTISCGRVCSLCLRLVYLPQSSEILLLSSGDDSKIHLYVWNLKDVFVEVDSLVGHEDWVQALDVTVVDSNSLLIASGSQDAMIRLWKLSFKGNSSELMNSSERVIRPKEYIFSSGCKSYVVTMETILTGHVCWIYSVYWHVSDDWATVKLLSISFDQNIIIWTPDSQTGVWLESARVGDVGGNSLGFYGGMFSPDGMSILSHGYQGSFHLWTYSADAGVWESKATVSGHFKEVVDIQWEPHGLYFLSVSKDQTTRLHAPCIHGDDEISWHEIARPQIHGFDMSCVAVLSRNKFASGAEEKIIRAFQAPNNFIDNFQRLCRVELKDIEFANVPEGASVPALGLSNKAVYEDEPLTKDTHIRDECPAVNFESVKLNEPPTEEHLIQNTLWPEIQKLYGHGCEIFCLAACPGEALLASACKATNAEHAVIILWDTSTWQQKQSLASHQLTVTQISFSPNGMYLLSVSRDRLWCLFKKSQNGFELISKTNKNTGIHSRIIWACAWSADSKYFATGSRDGKLCIWSPDTGEPKSLAVLVLKAESITAVAFQPEAKYNKYLLAIGLEIGAIEIYYWYPDSDTFEKVHHMDKNEAHHLTVKRLAFHPFDKSVLASCGEDGVVRVYLLNVS